MLLEKKKSILTLSNYYNIFKILFFLIKIICYTASLFGSTTGSTVLGAKLSSAVTTTTSVNRGLGGLDVSVNNKGFSQGSSSTAAKENLLPNELMQTIDKFK